jgi:hypothetical protein
MRLTFRPFTLTPFTRACLLALFVINCILLSACTTAWTTEASNIIAVLIPAIEGALGLISAFGVGISPSALTSISKWGNEATNDLANVIKPLIDQYNSAAASAKPALLEEIQTGLSVIVNNLSTLMPAIHVSDAATQAKINGVIEAISGEISALIALVPAIQGKVTSHEELKTLVANLKTPSEFKREYNAAVSAFGTAASPYLLK